jgi:hypothetical protein
VAWLGQSHSIRDRRSRLDPVKLRLDPLDPDLTADMPRYRFAGEIRSEPLELDPVAQIKEYRFSPPVLLKSPCVLQESTRSPPLVQK